ELLALLIVVGDLHVRAAPHLTLVRRHVTEQQPQERGLARSVRTDQSNAVAANDPRREGAHDRPPAVRLADRFRLEHHAAGGLGLLDGQPHLTGLLAALRALLPHRHQRANAAFISGAARLDALPQPRFFFGELLVEALPLGGLRRQRLLFAAE